VSVICFSEHTRKQEEKQVSEALLSNIENILLNGTQLTPDEMFETLEKLGISFGEAFH
jgi:hypothetical protein